MKRHNVCQTLSTLPGTQPALINGPESLHSGQTRKAFSLCLSKPLDWVLGGKAATRDFLTVAWLKPKLGCQGVAHTCQATAGCHYRAHTAEGRGNLRPQRSHTLAASVSVKLAGRGWIC